MPEIHVDFDQVTVESIAATDTDGAELVTTGLVIPVIIPEDSIEAWLELFDSTNQYSPSAADSRTIARAVLNALKGKSE